MNKILGIAGVDSGQLLIIDPCYLDSWKDGDYVPEKEADNDYHRACEITQNKEMGGSIKGGVVLSTGYGDGAYPVEVEYSDEGDFGVRIRSVKIKFF